MRLRHAQWLSCLLVGCTLSGCGGGCSKQPTAPQLPFKPGVVRVIDPDDPAIPRMIPLAVLTVVEPAPGTKVSPGQRFPCVIRAVVPPGGQLPTFVMACIIDRTKESQWFSVPAAPKAQEAEDVFLYQAQVKAPPHKGRYRVRADGQLIRMTQTKVQAEPVLEDVDRFSSPPVLAEPVLEDVDRFSSPPILIEVR